RKNAYSNESIACSQHCLRTEGNDPRSLSKRENRSRMAGRHPKPDGHRLCACSRCSAKPTHRAGSVEEVVQLHQALMQTLYRQSGFVGCGACSRSKAVLKGCIVELFAVDPKACSIILDEDHGLL